MPLLGSGDEIGDSVGVAVVHLGQHGGVDIGGGDDGGVSEEVLDGLEVGAGGEGEAGHAVAQVVQPDRE
jgi:hypothetical protein